MKFLFDPTLSAMLFVPGASVSLGAWLSLFPVDPLAFLVALSAMVVGGTGLVIQRLMR